MRKALLLSLLACATALASTSASAQTRVGHVNTGLILESLPETAVADSLLQLYQDSLTAGGQTMQDTFLSKLTYLQENQENLTPRKAQELQTELQEMQQEIQTFQQLAAQNFEYRRGQYLQPIVTRVRDAVAAYAKTNGYNLILDASLPQSLLFANAESDLTPAIITELGGAAPTLTLSTD